MTKLPSWYLAGTASCCVLRPAGVTSSHPVPRINCIKLALAHSCVTLQCLSKMAASGVPVPQVVKLFFVTLAWSIIVIISNDLDIPCEPCPWCDARGTSIYITYASKPWKLRIKAHLPLEETLCTNSYFWKLSRGSWRSSNIERIGT